MSASDGLILFISCALSFTLGYVIGCVRVCRFVSAQLDQVKEHMTNIAEHAREIRLIYSKLGGENDKT
jgi:hypothetical protein